jgi:hypothetical protein
MPASYHSSQLLSHTNAAPRRSRTIEVRSGSKAALAPCRLQCPVCPKADNQACYSITSSARTRILVGTSRPRARAVFRLVTRLNLVGCKIGSSPGGVPTQRGPISWVITAIAPFPVRHIAAVQVELASKEPGGLPSGVPDNAPAAIRDKRKTQPPEFDNAPLISAFRRDEVVALYRHDRSATTNHVVAIGHADDVGTKVL